MKLLIITQKVDKNDPILGFFHGWLLEFAKHCERLTVVCLYQGECDLPSNLRVLSLGKEGGTGKVRQLGLFFKYIFKYTHEYDAVFVHMNPIYIVLGGIFWRLLGKKVALWYTHRQVDFKLRVAEKFTDIIFTASQESFMLKTKKVKILKHGINVGHFRFENRSFGVSGKINIITVGRISPIKNTDILIEAVDLIKNQIDFNLKIIGSPQVNSDKKYLEKIKEVIKNKKLGEKVVFIGDVTYEKLPKYYQEADIVVNLSPDGGVDKVVLEGMASGVLCLASNRSFAPYFGDYKSILLFKERDVQDLASKIVALTKRDDKKNISSFLVGQAEKLFSQETLVKNIIGEMKLLQKK